MQVFTETNRLILRELLPEDANGILALDSDPEVKRYLDKATISTIAQAHEIIDYIRTQYQTYGIGRWAVIEKATQQFLGWAGLKWRADEVNGHARYYDVGYRLIRQYWGKGYATEATIASMQYGFHQLHQPVLYAMADVENHASIRVLEKAGFYKRNTLMYEGSRCYWFDAAAPAADVAIAPAR